MGGRQKVPTADALNPLDHVQLHYIQPPPPARRLPMGYVSLGLGIAAYGSFYMGRWFIDAGVNGNQSLGAFLVYAALALPFVSIVCGMYSVVTGLQKGSIWNLTCAFLGIAISALFLLVAWMASGFTGAE